MGDSPKKRKQDGEDKGTKRAHVSYGHKADMGFIVVVRYYVSSGDRLISYAPSNKLTLEQKDLLTEAQTGGDVRASAEGLLDDKKVFSTCQDLPKSILVDRIIVLEGEY